MPETHVQQALSERRLHALSDLSLRTADAETSGDVWTRGLTALAALPDLPFALLFTVDEEHDEGRWRLEGSVGLPTERPDASEHRTLAELAGPHLWGLDGSPDASHAIVLIDLDDRHQDLLSLVRSDPPPTAACVIPIPAPDHGEPLGFLVAGLHPAQRFNTETRAFLHLVANGLSCAAAALTARHAEQRHAELLDEIERSTSAFFDYIAHELRTPLHAILGWAQVLRRDGVSPQQLTKGLEAIERNARAQSHMVDALVALRRGMSGLGADSSAVLAAVPESAAPKPPLEPVPPASSLEPELEGLTVLVVDDNLDAREVVTEGLSRAGAHVIAAASSEEGLGLITRRHPDVIVSDLGLPDEDGYSFMQHVRSLEPSEGGTTPAVALSAFALPAHRERALRSGYQMHLAKPAEQSELVTVCASLAGRLL